MDTDVLLSLLLYYTILDGMVAVVRIRKENITRDREAAFARLNAYTADEFRRRFRMWRYQFEVLVAHLRQELEPQTAWAKQCAINSSGSWVRAELKIAATLRVLAGGSYLDASDLYAVSAISFHRNTFWPVIIAVCNCHHAVKGVVGRTVSVHHSQEQPKPQKPDPREVWHNATLDQIFKAVVPGYGQAEPPPWPFDFSIPDPEKAQEPGACGRRAVTLAGKAATVKRQSDLT